MLVEFEIPGIQLKESGIPTMIGIFQVPLTKNPESSTRNPELQMASSIIIRFWEAAHLPLPGANINTYYSLSVKCWLRGGVGGHLSEMYNDTLHGAK